MTDRINREIDDLLRHIEERERRSVTRRMSRWTHSVSETWQKVLSSFLRRSPVEQFMLASVLLVVASFILQYVSRPLAFYSSVLGLLLFVLALGISLLSPGGQGRYQKRWRGRVLDYGPPSIWMQLRQWLRRRR